MSTSIEKTTAHLMDTLTPDDFAEKYRVLMVANDLTPNQAIGYIVAQHHNSRNQCSEALMNLEVVTGERDGFEDALWSTNIKLAFAAGIAGLLLIRVSYLSHWFG